MSVLVSGSLAIDFIMVFPDRFKNHILPDRLHVLNVAFHVPTLRKSFGGTAGNIAYHLRLLGEEPIVLGTVGSDFGEYAEWLDRHGISRRGIRVHDDLLTAQAFITTDLDDNQITAFHPGAMEHAHVNRVPVAAGIDIGVVSPDGRQGMIEHAAQFAAAGIPYLFDPGQGLPMFDGEDLRRFISQAAWVTVNDYEGRLLTERSGWSEAEIAGQVRALVVTRGGQGSTIFTGGRRIDIPPVSPVRIADPTGCGDAYRAGLLYGIGRNLAWEETGRLASLIGSLKIAEKGTQNHHFTPASLMAGYLAAFGQAIAL